MRHTTDTEKEAAERYLDLMKKCLTRYLFIDEEARDVRWDWRRRLGVPTTRLLGQRGTRAVSRLVRRLLVDGRDGEGGPQGQLGRPVLGRAVGEGRTRHGWRLVKVGADAAAREAGRDWPPHAETMVGLRRLDNVQQCVTDVVLNDVPGDLIETGVWRGGTAIFMRAVLAAYGDTARRVWAADSFRGLPPPDVENYPADVDLDVWFFPELSVSVEEVKANFARYGLLDDQVEFLEGWFSDTLQVAPIDRLAVIRLDGDLYESTMQSLTALYPKLSVGGYVIVDDYADIEACRQAVTDYRAANGITEEIHPIDWTGVYWQRSEAPTPG